MDVTSLTDKLKGQAGSLGTAVAGLAGKGGEGLSSLVDKLKSGGLGEQVSSWVGHGQNKPVDAEQVKSALGDDEVAKVAEQAGVSNDEAAQGMAGMLPQVVDHLTPEGKLPDAG